MVIIASVLVLGGAGAGAAWYYKQLPNESADEGSVRTLAANALGTAREAAVFFRESATRDIGALATLLRETTASDTESETDAEERDAVAATARATVAPPPIMGPTVNELMAGAPGPSLGRAVAAGAALPTEPPLFMVFDETYPEIVPPGTDDIRIPRSSLGDMWIADVATPDTGLVEVVVGATGSVETAKLISAPQNVHESMFLSAIKAWQFTPALLDGQGVRYRQRMHIAVSR